MTEKDPQNFGHVKQGRARAALVGVLWSGVTSLLPTLVSALVFLLTSRILHPQDFGLVAFAAVVVGTIAVFSPSGFTDAIIQRGQMEKRHLDTVFWLGVGAGSMLYLVILAVAVWLEGRYHDPLIGTLMRVIGLKVIFDQLTIVPKALLSRSMAFRKMAMRTITASMISGVICLAVLFAGYGLWALVASQLVVSIVSCLVSWLSVDWRPSTGFDGKAFRDLARFGAFSSGSQIVTSINAEQLMIGSFMGPVALGLYNFARRIFQMMTDVMSGALNTVTYPLLSSMQDETEKLRHTYLTATFLSSSLAVPAYVGMALVADQLVPLLMGEQWTQAIIPLRALCAVGILACIGILQSSLIRSKGHAATWMWYQVVQQILTVIVVLITYRYGIAVVSVAIAIKIWLVWPVTAIIAARLIKISLWAYLGQFLIPLGAAAGMAVVVLTLDAVMTPGLVSLCTQIVAGAAIYAMLLLVFARKRLAMLRALIQRRR